MTDERVQMETRHARFGRDEVSDAHVLSSEIHARAQTRAKTANRISEC